MQDLTPFAIAKRFVGLSEGAGTVTNPAILAMLQLDQSWPKDDETPWCSALANTCAWLADHERSQSLRARSWLRVGAAVHVNHAIPGDVVVLMRGGGNQPGPDVINAPGHVGFFTEWLEGRSRVSILGGNQSNQVSISSYPATRILGIRRLRPAYQE